MTLNVVVDLSLLLTDAKKVDKARGNYDRCRFRVFQEFILQPHDFPGCFEVRSIKFFPGVYFPLDENVPYVPSVNEGIWLPGAGNVEGKMVALYFLPIVLVASVVGIASICVGMYHLRVWRTDSLAAAVSAALIAWLLSFLAAG